MYHNLLVLLGKQEDVPVGLGIVFQGGKRL